MINLRSRFVRLAVVMTILPTLILTGVGYLAIKQFDKQLTSEIQNQISDDIAGLVEIYTDGGSGPLVDAIQSRIKMDPYDRASGYYRLTGADDRVFFEMTSSASLHEAQKESGVNQHKFIISKDGIVRSTTLKAGEKLTVGREIRHKNTALKNLQSLFLKSILLCVLLGLIAGLIATWGFKRRLRKINDLCHQVADGEVSARLADDETGDEISHLSGNINVMLGRIQNLVSVRKRISDQVAHELRTPLTQLDAALQDAALAASEPAALETARGDLKNCVTLLDALLDVSALEAQSGDRAGFEAFDLSILTADMCEFYEALAAEKHQTLTCGAAHACMINGDPTQIGRLIANLVDNAIKYTPDNGTIHVSTETNGEEVILRVTDSGPGIAPENKSNIFTPFFRSSKNAASTGHGLGLAMVKAIADRHDGRLVIEDTAENTENRSGASFSLVLKNAAQSA